jgi:hypothetical protein
MSAIELIYPQLMGEEAPAPDPQRAVCKVERIPTKVFFIENERAFPLLVEDAKSFCARCPEREVCLVFALSNKIRDGIYGGRTGSERDRMRRKEKQIVSRQAFWHHELHNLDWDWIAASMGLPEDWRQFCDLPEHMIDSDSEFFRAGDGLLGCKRKRNGCSQRFVSLEECFRHANDPTARHFRSTKEPE